MLALTARSRLVAVALVALAVVLAVTMLPVERLLMNLQQWAQTAGPCAPVLFVALIAAGFLLLLPSSPQMMLAGFLFGTLQGMVVVWLAGLIASTAAFHVGRGLARPWIERRIRRKGLFIAIDRAIRRKSFLIVLLTRLVMLLPYPPLNYTLGLTAVGTLPYVAATNLGMIGPMFLFVYLGASAADLATVLAGDVQLDGREIAWGLGGLLAVLIGVALIVRSAARVLREELATLDAVPGGPERS
jgi:uncharacterized membrane protein YdjX (TVP38/TMEM64 family)